MDYLVLLGQTRSTGLLSSHLSSIREIGVISALIPRSSLHTNHYHLVSIAEKHYPITLHDLDAI